MMWAMILVAAYAVAYPQTRAGNHQNQTTAAPPQGGSTPGRIAKFTTTKAVGDSNITEDSNGNIGIGTTLPTSTLTVNGIIEMLSGGGIKFPDGTVQTTAGLTGLTVENTLKGNGTQALPLGIAAPLILNGQLGVRGIVQATNTSPAGIGVVGNGGSSGSGVAGFGGDSASGFGGRGVTARGGSSNGSGGGIGIEAIGGASSGNDGGEGVRATGGDGSVFGGLGVNATGGQGNVLGGDGMNATGGWGITGSGGVGVRASGGFGFGTGKSGGVGIVADGGIGVDGASRGLAGRFNGDVLVTGTLSKGGGSFKIDHPLDPENKYLSHSFVESPDMMNIYNGNITTDQNGLAVVELPDYFEALNRDFRYQLTVIGQFAQAIVAEKVKGNRFTIQTSAPGVEVSWQVTGIRQDAWANKNRIQVEEAKSEKERGHYLHPESFGKEKERSVEWATQPETMSQSRRRPLN
jgi:hypothetical protein